MAITLEKFVKVTGAEEVAGNVIVGIMASRKIVGKVENGTFNLNDDGKAIAEQIEAGTFKKDQLVVATVEVEAVEAIEPTAVAEAPVEAAPVKKGK